jgi:hypothetical protein
MWSATSASFLKLKENRVRSEFNAATSCSNWSDWMLRYSRIDIRISFLEGSGNASAWLVLSLRSRRSS